MPPQHKSDDQHGWHPLPQRHQRFGYHPLQHRSYRIHYGTERLQVFAAKFVLEVMGGAGAIWGFSEAIGWRNLENVWFWRPVALTGGFIFFLRWTYQLLLSCSYSNEESSSNRRPPGGRSPSSSPHQDHHYHHDHNDDDHHLHHPHDNPTRRRKIHLPEYVKASTNSRKKSSSSNPNNKLAVVSPRGDVELMVATATDSGAITTLPLPERRTHPHDDIDEEDISILEGGSLSNNDESTSLLVSSPTTPSGAAISMTTGADQFSPLYNDYILEHVPSLKSYGSNGSPTTTRPSILFDEDDHDVDDGEDDDEDEAIV